MESVDPEIIKTRMAGLTTPELKAVLGDGSAQYTEDALEIAAQELSRRAEGPIQEELEPPLPTGPPRWMAVASGLAVWIAWALILSGTRILVTGLLTLNFSGFLPTAVIFLVVGSILIWIARILSLKWYKYLTIAAGIYCVLQMTQVVFLLLQSAPRTSVSTNAMLGFFLEGFISLVAFIVLFTLRRSPLVSTLAEG